MEQRPVDDHALPGDGLATYMTRPVPWAMDWDARLNHVQCGSSCAAARGRADSGCRITLTQECHLICEFLTVTAGYCSVITLSDYCRDIEVSQRLVCSADCAAEYGKAIDAVQVTAHIVASKHGSAKRLVYDHASQLALLSGL